MNDPGNATTRLERRAAWAREQLEIGDQASPIELRARFMTLLRDEQFVPNEASVQAYWSLQEASDGIVFLQDPAEFVLTQEQQAEGLVEDFSEQMFKLPPEQRQQRWDELVEQCSGCVQVSARLNAFRPALQIDTNDYADAPPMVRQFAEHLADMFVMSPGRRAVARDRLLQLVQQEPAQWQAAARAVKLNFPELAALDKKLVRIISQWREQQVRAKQQRARQLRAQAQPAPVTTTSSGHGSLWWIVVPIAVGAILAAVRTSTEPSKNKKSVPEKWRQSDQNEQLRRQLEQLLKDNPTLQRPTHDSPRFAPPTYLPPTYPTPTDDRPPSWPRAPLPRTPVTPQTPTTPQTRSNQPETSSHSIR